MPPLTDSESEVEQPFTKVKNRRWRRRSMGLVKSQGCGCSSLGKACPRGAAPRDRSCTSRVLGVAPPRGCVGTLEVITEDEVNGVKENVEEWEEIEFLVDSSASATVIGKDSVHAVSASDPDSRKSYRLVDGSITPDKGRKRFLGMTDEGWSRAMTAHVTGVDRPLLSVSQIIQHGARVAFDEDGSYIDGPNEQEIIHLVQCVGLYTMKMWIPKDQTEPFQGQA